MTEHAGLVLASRRRVRRYDIHDSPLWPDGGEHSLWGRVVEDPREIREIRARVHRRRWWR